MRVVIPWYTIEKMPEIIACDAMTVAAILRRRNGIYRICTWVKTISKRIFLGPGCVMAKAPWPK